MSSFLIISIMADDRPGLVETLSSIVKEQQGNWLESRMSLLAGKFAGIVHVQVADSHKADLEQALLALRNEGWMINVEQGQEAKADKRPCAKLNIVGNDRPGIVKEVAKALAGLGVNVLELHTQFESAAMSAEPLFKTQADIQTPENLDLDEVCDALENLSNDLMVEVFEA